MRNTWNGSPQRELTTNTLSGNLEADHDWLAWFSLSHKRRASVRAGPALEIMVYAAEFPFPAA